MKDCKTCERRDKHKDGECLVFRSKPKQCWAWTDDTKWAVKVMKDVKRYREYKNGFIKPYWGDNL